ncbi:MAG: VOC family protein [Actinomycetota bacterium]
MTSPVKFAHMVLKTANFTEMVAWWKNFLGATARHENDFIAFLSYDDEHHRVAIVNMPHLGERDNSCVGLEHVAFTYGSLDDLFGQYERMKACGVSPYWTINHGMTLSAYYRDPDGNQVETQFDSMTMDEADEFMAGPLFAANPIGINVDFEALLARRRAGEGVGTLVDYATAGQ